LAKRNKKNQKAHRRDTRDATRTSAADDSSVSVDTERGWAAPLVTGIVALVVYLFTLAPTVTAEDSGELLTAAWHFGIPHPPGYPLWTILCGVFMRLVPFGEIAWRGNLFSAVCTAAAAGWFCAALVELRISRRAAMSAALVFALSRWNWMQAVITEVYGLNSLLTALLLYLVVRWYGTRNARLLAICTLLFGLGMGNHHTIALTALALIIWILAQAPALLRRPKLIAASLGLFAAGLLTYAYLPLRAQQNPPMNWGNPDTMERFIEHVTRQQYGAVGPTKTVEPRTLARTGEQLRYVAESIADDLTPPVAIAALFGLLVMLRHRRELALVLLWLACAGLLFTVLSNFDLDRISRFVMRVFLIPVTMCAAIPLAFAIDAVLRPLKTRLSPGERSRDNSKRSPTSARPQPPSRGRSVGIALGIVLAGAAPAWVAWSNWRQCDYSNYWYARDHAENLMACMLPNAMFFPSGDHNTFPFAYLALVEGERGDILIADLYGYTRPELYADKPADDPDTPEAWLIKRARRPVYFATKTRPPVRGASFVPAGLCYHLLPNGMTFDGDALLDACTYRNHQAGEETVEDLGSANINADFAFFHGLRALEHGELSTALARFGDACTYGKGVKELPNNIGSALAEHGHASEARPYFEQAATLDRHYALPRWNLYRVARDQRDWPEARKQLEAIIAADPTDAHAHGQLGFLLRDHFSDRGQAITQWRQSLALKPDQPQVRDALAELTKEADAGDR
jgi:tetratricopeptide (TPR) repeat protein